MSPNILRASVIVVALIVVGNAEAQTGPAKAQGRGQTNLLRWPLADQPKSARRMPGPRLFLTYRLVPRAYPNTSVDPDARRKAVEQLQAMKVHQALLEQGSQPGPGTQVGPSVARPPGPPAPGVVDASGCAWISRGPTNITGRVASIAIDPGNNQRIFAATVGGIWRTANGGRRWERISDQIQSSVYATVFGSVAINPASPAEIFVGGGDPQYTPPVAASAAEALRGDWVGTGFSYPSPFGSGIWRSTSGGDPGSWTKVSPAELDTHTVYRLRVDPAAPNTVYAATSNGVYVGTRSGGTITFARLGGFDAHTSDIAVDFSVSPPRVYAGVIVGTPSYGRGIWKHDGTTWQSRDSGIAAASIRLVRLALAPSSPSTLFAKIARGRPALDLLGVFKTTTGGETPAGGGNAWARIDAPDAGGTYPLNSGFPWYNNVIEVDPSDPAIVWAGGTDIFRSTDGGVRWSIVSGRIDPEVLVGGVAADSWRNLLAVHADQHAIAFDPANPRIVFIGNDGGIDRSTDTSTDTWVWRKISNGMVTMELFRLGLQQSQASILAGGAQDNGSNVSFGNRTWYNVGGCDGSDVAVDAVNASTFYVNCNGTLNVLANPVPGTPGSGRTRPWTAPAGLAIDSPIVTDPGMQGATLAAGVDPRVPPLAAGAPPLLPARLLKATDGLTFANASPLLAANRLITFAAIAPASGFNTYYMGVVGGGVAASIWSTGDGGTMWNTTPVGVPNLWPTAVAVDWSNSSRAIATFAGTGAITLTVDRGANWTPLPGSGATALPAVAVTGAAMDPNDANVVYISTALGVFRGVITPATATTPAAAAWTPFNEGMPDGVDVAGIAVNRTTNTLVIATMGFGVYERDIGAAPSCPAVAAFVRDNVFDRGRTPTLSDVPDPEFPVADPARPPFYKPDDSPGGRLHWWTSTDIKVDTSPDDPAIPARNRLAAADVDHVAFDVCPTKLSECPPNTIIDSDPQRGRRATAFVQVGNRGTRPANNVRVIALWTDATTGLPLLPENFWSTTFPAGSGGCGPLDTSTGWNLVEPGDPCRVIDRIDQEVPQVRAFNWNVPAAAAEHSCLLVIIDSGDQPIASDIRTANERRLWILVPNSPQIALRNLHVIDAPAAPAPALVAMRMLNVPNPSSDKAPLELLFSQAGLAKGGRIAVVLPQGITPKAGEGARYAYVPLLGQQRRWALSKGLSAGRTLLLTGPTASLRELAIAPGTSARIGLLLQAGGAEANTAAKISVVARQRGTVLGGSTFLLRSVKR